MTSIQDEEPKLQGGEEFLHDELQATKRELHQ